MAEYKLCRAISEFKASIAISVASITLPRHQKKYEVYSPDQRCFQAVGRGNYSTICKLEEEDSTQTKYNQYNPVDKLEGNSMMIVSQFARVIVHFIIANNVIPS